MKPKSDPKELRKLAEEVIDKITEGGELFPSEREELVTSLVRQWTTYDGQAALFIGEQPYFFPLVYTPLGHPRTAYKLGPRNWLGIVATDWNIDPDDLGDIAGQLNRGQSAEVVTRDGESIRVWTNPSEELCAVEPLESVPPPQKPGVDYLKLATRCVMDRFGDDISEEEAEQLAASLVKQWKQSGGHASIYLDGNLVIHYTLQEHAGGSNITATEQASELGDLLDAMNVPPNEAPAIMARLNLGQTIEFRDARGWKIKVWHDPKQRRMIYERAGDSVPASGNPSLLASCPKCTALLIPQGDGLLPPACPICGCATTTTP